MIVNWNDQTLKPGQVFHFKNSLRPFISVGNANGDYCFLDFDEMTTYTLDELESEGLYFYTDETDDDFMGVELDGRVRWVND